MTKNNQQQNTFTNYHRLREKIYESLRDYLRPEYRVPGVENLFADGMPCAKMYDEMMDAYERLRERLGVAEEDDDVETIINSLCGIEIAVAMKMFDYGFLMKEAQQLQ